MRIAVHASSTGGKEWERTSENLEKHWRFCFNIKKVYIYEFLKIWKSRKKWKSGNLEKIDIFWKFENLEKNENLKILKKKFKHFENLKISKKWKSENLEIFWNCSQISPSIFRNKIWKHFRDKKNISKSTFFFHDKICLSKFQGQIFWSLFRL